jgi:hypothetical protein
MGTVVFLPNGIRATFDPATVTVTLLPPESPDAMRLDASTAEAERELAEWRALLDGAKGRRR